MGNAKYEAQFDAPVQGIVIGEHNTVNIYQNEAVTRNQPNSQNIPLPLWDIPFQRNRFFTGREHLLQQLHSNLTTNHATALTQAQAISGLGGIGKTQIAVEYVYRYRDEYSYLLWANAATQETLISSFRMLANLLQLPEKDEQEQNKVVEAVTRWLATHDRWLIIFDNADELELVSRFLPTLSTGHLMLITRSSAVGSLATSIEVEKMDGAEGALMLLRRAKILPIDASLDEATLEDKEYARAIVLEMDGLPLALDQAAAYIEETRSCLSDYLSLYRAHRDTLLKERGSPTFDHSESVSTTFSLAFQKVQEASLTAADLLRLCAFLSSDIIPEAVFTDYKPELDPTAHPIAANQLELNAAIKWLLKFSLVRRNSDTKTLTVHRLVQAVLRDEMEEEAQRQWAERTVRAVSRSFPFSNPDTWSACQRLLPHGYACTELIQQWNMEFVEASGLLYRMARYLHDQASYEEAELYYQKALKMCEKALGLEYLGLANILSKLAHLYHSQGKYTQAEPLYKRALAIHEKILGSEHHAVAIDLKDLSGLYSTQGKYAQAESCYTQALKLCKQALGPKHHEVGAILNDLALLYFSQGKYREAEGLYLQSLRIKMQKPEDINLSSNLSNLANVYRVQGKSIPAEVLSQRALSICEKIQGTEHPDVAIKMNNLAVIYQEKGKYAEAETLFLRALAIQEKTLGTEHPSIANTLANLATLDDAQGKYEQAEQRLKRAWAINDHMLGPGHPYVADHISKLAQCYFHQGKYREAEQHYKQSLAIWEYTPGLELPKFIITLISYACLLRTLEREAEALELERRARELRMRSV